MQIRTIAQPQTQLGQEFDALLNPGVAYSRIVFVSAFVGLSAVLRLRERLLDQMARGADLALSVGVDLGGTSRDVLEELLRWRCRVSVVHNAIARVVFHPKVYLFESAHSATLLIGSNNLTDGGLYTNYEAAVRYDFQLPEDAVDYDRLLAPLAPFLAPGGPTCQGLNTTLIEILAARGELPSEEEARKRRRNERPDHGSGDGPANPFGAVPVLLPPLLPDSLRKEAKRRATPDALAGAGGAAAASAEDPEERVPNFRGGHAETRALVWRKQLPQSDALQVGPGTNSVGGVRLTQAGFESPRGHRIDQTTYFRQLFSDFAWEAEGGPHLDKEHAFVPMRVVVRGVDHGVRNFEISHKPSGEAGQGNYTTILRWGREFSPIVVAEDLTDSILSLYETPDSGEAFLIEILDEE